LPKDEKKEAVGLKLTPRLIEILAKLQEIELEDFQMDVGDLEIWIQPGTAAIPTLAQPKTVPQLKLKPT